MFLDLVFLLHCVWVRVTSHSFSNAARNLGVIFHSPFALKEQVNKLCWLAYQDIRRIGSIRQYLLFFKPPTLSFPTLFSLSLIIVMLALLGLLRFSSIKFKEWSTVQLASSAKLLNLPISLLYFTIYTGCQSAADSIQNSSHLLPHCLWCSSSISLWVASSLLSFSLSSLSLRYSDLPCSSDGQETLGERSFQYIGPVIWNSLPLSVFTLFF